MKKSEFRTLLEEKIFIHTGSVNELAIEVGLMRMLLTFSFPLNLMLMIIVAF